MLKQVISTVLALLIACTSGECQTSSASPNVVTISKGTALKLETLSELNSATAQVGDDVPLQVMRAVSVQGVVLLPAGEILHGRVTKVKPRTPSQSGEVRWKLDKITFADSSTVPTEIFLVNAQPNANVPDHYSPIPWFRKWCTNTNDDLNCNDTIGLSVIAVPVMPILLFQHLFSSDRGEYLEYQLSLHSTVGLVLKKDHKVRY